MRIGNSSIDSLGSKGAGSVGGVPADSHSAAETQGSALSDTVSLSSASNLVSLAKVSTSPVQQAKIQSLAAQLLAGQYQADTAQVSQAVVQSHLA
jgi:anti-sigma28 factor (negative regulator of flagellin synthesis)